jgi:putative heme-binding domain-containing protein
VIPLLLDAVKAEGRSTTSRAVAIRGLARTEAGARELLRYAAEPDGGLEEPGRTTASLALAQSRWSEIRSEAAKVLPAPRSADGGELPSVSELIRLRGDAVRGATVFQSEQASCSKCHVAGQVGVDFGPALSQIGTKLGRQALYESILDPSSGISFGYEGWSVETRGGDEVFGILASETDEELAIKQQTGAVVRLKKSDVMRRERQQLSIMPAGLASVLSRQDLVDLVEYLTTLKAP